MYLPVFPDVGSIMVSPGFSKPALSASSTILRLIRSFTLPPALKYSHLATAQREGYNFYWLFLFLVRQFYTVYNVKCKLTYFTFEAEGFGDLVDAYQRSVSNSTQDGGKDLCGRRSVKKGRLSCLFQAINCKVL